MKLKSSKRTARYQKLRDTLIPWNKRQQGKDKKSNTNACSRKGCEKKRPYTNAYGKERKNRSQMSVAKKDETTNAGGKRKMAALLSQANSWHQMKEIKQLKPPQNPQKLPTCKHKVEKTHTKNTPPNHNSLIDYCLQQRSGRLQLEENRAKIFVPTTNRWKAKLTITNSKLTPH